MAIRLTSDQYHEEALREFPRYSLDNSWFKFEFPGGEFDMAAPVSYVFAGWAAYEKAQEAGAKMLLLGSEKLRTDEALITNFGLSSAKGVQEEKEDREKRKIDPTYKSPAEKAVAGAVAERAKVAAGVPLKDIPWNPNAKGVTPTPVVGKGSILSTKAWSPLLNDTFIMSGAHKGWDFVVGLSGSESTEYQKVASEGGDPKSIWKKFFLKQAKLDGELGMLWNNKYNIPRVMLREFLGLELFGYKPNFDKNQLWFTVGEESKSDGAKLGQYLVALKNYGFHESKKDPLVERVAKYLFGDGKALDGI
jgi:hypothetical protein